MTRFDKIMGNETEVNERKILKLVLDDGEDIRKCIEQGMKDNNLKDANVVEIVGNLKNATIDSKEGRLEFENIEFVNAKGKFKIGGGDLWGAIEVFTSQKKPIAGKLLKATASQDVEIHLEI
ncbi:MAG: DUF296 domain-containing protein [Candidatus ainarchaeum sp.]|nr:DUF296 domain-containing protein [Candidatus ainarchaeum sp.]